MNRDRVLTREEVRNPMGGAIHFVIRNAQFRSGDGSVAVRSVVELWRSDTEGSEHRFATVYRHECGEVAITLDDRCCVRHQTLLAHVLPAMNRFDELCGYIPKAGTPTGGAAIVCSEGGCDKCRGGAAAPIVAEMTEFFIQRTEAKESKPARGRPGAADLLQAIHEINEPAKKKAAAKKPAGRKNAHRP